MPSCIPFLRIKLLKLGYFKTKNTRLQEYNSINSSLSKQPFRMFDVHNGIRGIK